jgi:hypothetical protein
VLVLTERRAQARRPRRPLPHAATKSPTKSGETTEVKMRSAIYYSAVMHSRLRRSAPGTKDKRREFFCPLRRVLQELSFFGFGTGVYAGREGGRVDDRSQNHTN